MKRASKAPTTKKKPAAPRNSRAKTNGSRARATSPALEAYLTLLEEIWADVHPLIGAVTLSALFRSAARRLAPAHPCVATLQVPVEGVDREKVRSSLGKSTPDESAAALRDLVRDLLTLFESIAGPVIVRLLLPKIVRAETVA